MAILLTQPYDDAETHPAYRPLIYDVVNSHSDQTKAAGIICELRIYYNTTLLDTVTLISKKVLPTFFSGVKKIYRFDFQNIVQEYLSHNFSDIQFFFSSNEKIDDKSEVWIYPSFKTLFINSDGLIEQLESLTAYGQGIVVLNATRQHEEWVNYGSNLHFAMIPYNFVAPYNTVLKYLTKKRDGVYLDNLQSEWLSFHANKDGSNSINAYAVRTYDSLGNQLSLAVKYLSSFNVINAPFSPMRTNARRKIGVGPVQLGGSGYDYISGINPPINNSVAYYDVTLVNYVVVVFGGSTLHLTIPLSESRRYYRTGNISPCADEVRLHFLNDLGGIDSTSLTEVEKQTAEIKSSRWKKGLSFPHRIKDFGSQRLSVASNKIFLAAKLIEAEDLDFIEELSDSVMVYQEKVKGTDYNLVPVVLRDKNIDSELKDGLIPFEIEIEAANSKIKQRN